MLSCSNKDSPSIISGNLSNIQDSIITIDISAYPSTRIKPSAYKNEFALEKDGTFSIPVTMNYPGVVTLMSNEYQFVSHVILLRRGEIHLRADCDMLNETLEYHGSNSGLNTFNFQWTNFYSAAYREFQKQVNDYRLYINGLDSLQSISLKMLEDFSRMEKLNKKEVLWLKSKINYGSYSSLYRRANHLNDPPGDSAYHFVQSLNLEDHDAIQLSPTYVNVILDYILHEVNATGSYYSSFKDNSEYFDTFYQIIHERLTGKVRDVILTIFVSNLLNNYEGLAVEFYERYLVNCKSPDLIEITSDLYADYLEIVNQSLSEKVVLIPTDQASPMEVLSRFENKVLLLDFWASWCSPCIKGIPQVKKLAEHFKNSDVEVVFIGFDDQESNLINAIKEHQLEGMHIILNKEETGSWRKEFSIRGIPTYVLMDKEGRVVNMDKPNQINGDTYSAIDSLLLAI